MSTLSPCPRCEKPSRLSSVDGGLCLECMGKANAESRDRENLEIQMHDRKLQEQRADDAEERLDEITKRHASEMRGMEEVRDGALDEQKRLWAIIDEQKQQLADERRASNAIARKAADAIDRMHKAEMDAHEARNKVVYWIEHNRRKSDMLEHVRKVFQALAEDDRAFLSTINEMYQADVDTVVAERIEYRATLSHCREALQSLEVDALGYGGTQEDHWSLRDELLSNVTKVLDKRGTEGPVQELRDTLRAVGTAIMVSAEDTIWMVDVPPAIHESACERIASVLDIEVGELGDV